MTDRLDQRIRELFVELDAVAPAPPPTPKVSVPAAVPGWVRGVSVASAAAVVVLVLGVAGQLFFNSEDSAEPAPDDVGAPATTSAEAEAAETTAAPPGTRPTEEAMVLAELNLACTTFIRDTSDVLPDAPVTDQEFIPDDAAAFRTVFLELSDVILMVEFSYGFDPYSEIGPLTEQIAADLSDFAAGSFIDGVAAYGAIESDIVDLGLALEGFGALDCGGLATGLP